MPQVQRHLAILVVCWGCCSSLGKRCNFWLTLHWWASQLFWKRRECSARAQWSRDSERSVGRGGMKMRSWNRGVEAITDRLIKCEQIPILGSACTLRYLFQETQRYTSKLLRSLQDDIRSANATQITLDAWLEYIYYSTVGTNSPSRNLYLASWLLVIS